MSYATLAIQYFKLSEHVLLIPVATATNEATGETKPIPNFFASVFLLVTAIEYLLKDILKREGMTDRITNHRLGGLFHKLKDSTQIAIDDLNSDFKVKEVLNLHNEVNTGVRYLDSGHVFFDIDSLKSVYGSIAKYWSNTYWRARPSESKSPPNGFRANFIKKSKQFHNKLEKAKKT